MGGDCGAVCRVACVGLGGRTTREYRRKGLWSHERMGDLNGTDGLPTRYVRECTHTDKI